MKSERIFKCKRHGILTEENSYKATEDGRLRLRCRECRNSQGVIYRANGKEKICKHHGALKPEDIGSRGRCNICVKEYCNKRDSEMRSLYGKALYQKNIKAERIRCVIKNKNITREQYYEMINNQNNKCKICNKNETRIGKNGIEIARLCIDHDHATGKVRALLCHDCNTGLGKFRDSITLFQRSIDYLKEHNTNDEIGGSN